RFRTWSRSAPCFIGRSFSRRIRSSSFTSPLATKLWTIPSILCASARAYEMKTLVGLLPFAISRSLTPRPCLDHESAPYLRDHVLPFGRWIALPFEEQWRDTFFLASKSLECHLVEKDENRNVEGVSICEFHPLRGAEVEGRRGDEKYSRNGILDP